MSGLPTSKMMVNHNRMRENNMAKDQAQKHWETISDAIQKIYDHKASSLSYEELYRTAYSLVLHKHGEMLYNNVKNITQELLRPIADRILRTHDDAFLVELNRTWSDEKMCIIMIKDILLYMNKNYVPKTKLPPVEHMQTSQFKHHVVLQPQIKQRLLSRLMSQIKAERDGGIIEKSQMRSTVNMLIDMSMGGNNKRIYEQEFENVLLAETADYYRMESNRLIVDTSCSGYLSKAHQRLQEEYERVGNYLASSTEPKLIETFLKEYVGEKHAQTLISMESSGLVDMLRQEKLEDLTLIYQMFSRIPESFALFRKHLQNFIEADGLKLVKDDKMKNEVLIAQLIEMRERVVNMWTKSMNKDPNIDITLKFGFEKIVNIDNRVAKALVQYIDEMFKKDFKTISEADLNDRIDKVIQIFRYLNEKDVFEGFYKNSFAKRLLDQRHINDDVERTIVLKLKQECGFHFTQRLEVMFKDMKMSDELMIEFRATPSAKNLPLELNMKVLTQGHWPNEKQETNMQSVSLPREISNSMTAFTQFYFTKFNNGRQLNWKLNEGSAELRGNFNNRQHYEFQGSTYQMILLTLFNDSETHTYQNIISKTQFPIQDLQMHLIPLIKCKLLLKTPQSNSLEADHELRVNLDYKSNLYKNKLAVLVSKTEKKVEQNQVQGKVEDDRRYAIEAVIVKVMKSRRKIEYINLVVEATKMLTQRFTPDPAQMKQRIEHLMERGYMERDTEDKRILKYIA